MPDEDRGFQASAGRQGRQFAEQCRGLLQDLGYRARGARRVASLGVELDDHAVSPRGEEIWFEFKGSLRGSRPGLRRTDTLKKAIANGALLATLEGRRRYVVLTSHLPESGAAAAMLDAALAVGYVDAALCIYDPEDVARLAAL